MRITLIAIPLLAAACFNPTFDAPTCDPGGPCPDGLTCIDGVCRDMTIDPPDATEDDCYQEANEEANDSAAEGTGIVIGSGTTRLCGEFADRVPSGGIVDADLYEITGGNQPLTATITATGAGDYSEVLIQLATFVEPVTGESGEVTTQFAVTSVQLAVQASSSAQVGHATAYEIVIGPADLSDLCYVAAADYTEALDTVAGGHTENDVLQGMLQGVAVTPSATDVPEQLPATLDLGATTKIRLGGTAFNTVTQGDLYKDRDTYLLTTGPETTSATFALTWPEDPGVTTDNADLDLFVYAESNLVTVFSGAQFGAARPEFGTVAVTPGTRYYVVVPTYQDAQADKTYDVFICGNFPP